MSEPSLELDKPQAIATLDRLTTNVALSLVAVIPTFFVCILQPWRVANLVREDHPEGRSGMLLSPGAYFPLSLLVSMIAGAVLTTPEIADYNGAYLGPDLALSIQAAMSEGDIWKTIAIIMPIYGFAVLAGALGLSLKVFASEDWSLRTSLRTVFYVVGTFVSWVILSTAAIDLVRVHSQNRDLVNTLNGVDPVFAFGAL
ncbi:MAG: hypothetical protein HRT81_02700, partial [Henriciella sp.]|nr:hypothetical protein [Henriciella sp.]